MIWLGTSSIEFASFVKLFSLPSFRVLYLSDFIFNEACGSHGDDNIIPHIPIELSQESGVKHFTLDFACVESGLLIALLQLLGPLKKFAFGFAAEDITTTISLQDDFTIFCTPPELTERDGALSGAEMCGMQTQPRAAQSKY
jgi:hypothetical protein